MGAIVDFLMNYIVPVVGGVFVLFFISLFFYILHRSVLKPLGVYTMIRNCWISRNKQKLLADEKIIEYCVARIQKNWTEHQVREELLLANRYSSTRIDEMIYAFNIIKKEMQGDKKKDVAKDLP